jgi:hypothetical protein
MTEYDLYPSFIQIDYTTVFGAHVHIIPTRAWNNVSLTGSMGSFTDWLGATRDAEDMIDDLVTAMKGIHKDDTTINLATIFNKASVDAPSIPVATKAIGVAGTSTLTTHAKAISAQLNFRTDNFHPMKLVFLDVPHPATDFNKETYASTPSYVKDIADQIRADQNAWAGRDNEQPSVLISVTWNINQALRKQYHMA